MGRPVLAQETGFSEWLKASGVFVPFSNAAEAAAGVRAIETNYSHHCLGARSIAEEYFDSCEVLPKLIETIYQSTPSQKLASCEPAL